MDLVSEINVYIIIIIILNVVYMPAQNDFSVKLIVHKSLLTHGK